MPQARGKTPGQDFAVVGSDGIDKAALWRLALTTVSIAPHRIGVEAARLLLGRIEHPDGAPRQVIPAPKLVVRESRGANLEKR